MRLRPAGGGAALDMFREVLIASASLPGLFPPRRIRVVSQGQAYEELHVDGGVSAPLFVMPEAFLRWRQLGKRIQRGRVYVLINTVLDPPPVTTTISLPAVLIRSLDTMLRASYRQGLSVAASFCLVNNLPLRVASIAPTSGSFETGGMLNFETATMKRTFEAAFEAALSDRFWLTPVEREGPWSDLLAVLKR